jgi:hypothetical protein
MPDAHIFVDTAGSYVLRPTPDMIHYSGIVDFEGLYRMLVKWFRDRKYDFYETLYKDKPPELEIEWAAWRKLDDFYKHDIRISFHLYDIKDVETIKDGVKKKMIYTRMIMKFDPIIIYDWQNRWSESPLTKVLFKFYMANVVKREFQLKYADALWYLHYQLHAKVKEFLGMETAGNAF